MEKKNSGSIGSASPPLTTCHVKVVNFFCETSISLSFQGLRYTHTHTKDDQGVWHTDERRITIIAEDYCKGLFISSNPVNMDGVLNSVERVVTDGMNQTLTNSYTCRGRSKGVTFSDAPLEGTRTGWHVTLFLSKVLAHSRARRYLYYSISFTFWYSVSIK